MEPRDFIERPRWAFKQLLPLSYWTKYRVADGSERGQLRLAIWRMWFGRCFDVVDVPVVG